MRAWMNLLTTLLFLLRDSLAAPRWLDPILCLLVHWSDVGWHRFRVRRENKRLRK